MATQEQLQDAARGVKQQVNEQKEGTASSLGSFAGALRKAARETQDGGQVNRMAEWAADGLERVSSTLRNKDMDAVMRDVQSFARQQPVAFFAAAVAAGFLASRFLKAGAGTGDGRPQEAMPQNFPPPGAGGVSATERADISSTTPF
jgi:hypothetical protein